MGMTKKDETTINLHSVAPLKEPRIGMQAMEINISFAFVDPWFPGPMVPVDRWVERYKDHGRWVFPWIVICRQRRHRRRRRGRKRDGRRCGAAVGCGVGHGADNGTARHGGGKRNNQMDETTTTTTTT